VTPVRALRGELRELWGVEWRRVPLSTSLTPASPASTSRAVVCQAQQKQSIAKLAAAASVLPSLLAASPAFALVGAQPALTG
jgi:hypothetical protein